jgi:hypothetical protein
MKSKYTYILIPLFVSLFVFSSTAFAQGSFPEEVTEEFLEPEEERTEPNDFGPEGWFLDFIGAAKCVQLGTPAAWQNGGAGYIYRTGGPTDWWCPVQLPNGVYIWRVRCYYYDNSNTDQVKHWLERYTGTNTVQTIGPAAGVGTGVGATPGFTSEYFAPIHIVDNRFGYAIRIRQTTTDFSTMLRGCRISYRKVQSAAGSQIFDDVPGGPFFQSINNLFRSGITQGCPKTPGFNYCPKDVVTREQMAAFLSRGFGLWQGYNTPDP